MQLAIDTSTDIVSLALADESQVVAELSWRSGQNHSKELLPQLTQLLKLVGTDIKAVTEIIVAKGPGSYNGLRVGISTAKGLAFSLGVPIAGVSTLEAEARKHALSGLPICPMLNAGRGEFATALYQQKNNRWLKLIPEHLATLESITKEVTTKTLFCGEIDEVTRAKLKRRLKENAVFALQASQLGRAAYLIELGGRLLKAGKADDPATLQPLYLRRPSITEPKRRIEWRADGKLEERV